jgi:aminopeptidase N
MIKNVFSALAISLLIFGCKSTQKVSNNLQTIELDTVEVFSNKKEAVYNASETKYFDLIHTKLAVRFDWEKRHLLGKENVWLKPHFYPQNIINLDAKGMEISEVSLINSKTNTSQSVQYEYDGMVLSVKLPQTVTRKDTVQLYISYTAKPDEYESSGSAAITEDKGLYFINPDGKTPNKPKQIWTQGETEANSRWFPTIDSPNQKSTQEIAITVDTSYITLSNGLLVMSELNGDGTRTDHWEMKLKHAPYLFMMAIGDFAEIKDHWRDIDVNYYVEHPYAPYAKDIFGNTPEMLEFYSQRLGYTYPWPKYHQVVVRDYVSGAMENTSCVIHGEFIQRTKRELLDEDNEDIVAHELFHHWFGDLVTCESWANLPLNESFATYGEYLWLEYKYGKDEADFHIYNDLMQYLNESISKQENLIRFDYEDKEDMFDAHSYQKGGRVLHMLRNYVGDDAFFTSLQKYLTDNQFTDVEIHELRLAFEDVTGEDLNWFFNQWFLSSGHPMLNIDYSYVEYTDTVLVTIEQLQDLETTPLFRLPIRIDVYDNEGKVHEHFVDITKQKEVFAFKVNEGDKRGEPKLVNVDAEKVLLAEKVDNKSKEWYRFQYYNAPLFLDRYEAIIALQKYSDSLSIATVIDALNDKFWAIRHKAVKGLDNAIIYGDVKEKIKNKLEELALNDEKSKVRAAAIDKLNSAFKADALTVYEKALNDSSYLVESRALYALMDYDKDIAIEFAKKNANTKNSMLLNTIAGLYSRYGDKSDFKFFENAYQNMDAYSKYQLTFNFGKYLEKQPYELMEKGLPYIFDMAENGGMWWLRYSGYMTAKDLIVTLKDRKKVLEREEKDLSKDPKKQIEIKNELNTIENLITKIENKLSELKAKENHTTLKRYLEGF